MKLLLSLIIAVVLPLHGQGSQSNHRQLEAASLRSLSGRHIYLCNVQVLGSVPNFNHITDMPVKDHGGLGGGSFFTGDELTIVSAESNFERIVRDPKFPTVKVTLHVQNPGRAKAGDVDLEVNTFALTPQSILLGITSNLWFSRWPVDSSNSGTADFPRIGMTKDDVECRMGLPDHTNTDALSGDQMVYDEGKVLIYISTRTYRVVDIQTSF